jgi:hypothetical protein
MVSCFPISQTAVYWARESVYSAKESVYSAKGSVYSARESVYSASKNVYSVSESVDGALEFVRRVCKNHRHWDDEKFDGEWNLGATSSVDYLAGTSD